MLSPAEDCAANRNLGVVLSARQMIDRIHFRQKRPVPIEEPH
jgi:hypothetical protein